MDVIKILVYTFFITRVIGNVTLRQRDQSLRSRSRTKYQIRNASHTKMTNGLALSLTLSIPHFSNCGKMSLPKRSASYWSNPPVYFLTLGHSGAQSWASGCPNVKKLKRVG